MLWRALQRPSAIRAYLLLRRDRLRPFALLRHCPQPWWDVTPTATTASLPRSRHWPSASLPLRESVPVPALLMSQVLCCRRCPFDPLARRTGLGTSQLGCKAALAPALPKFIVRLRGIGKPSHFPYFAPIPLSHLFGDACHYRVSQAYTTDPAWLVDMMHVIIGCLRFDKSVSP
jgi:hypothetical protein